MYQKVEKPSFKATIEPRKVTIEAVETTILDVMLLSTLLIGLIGLVIAYKYKGTK